MKVINKVGSMNPTRLVTVKYVMNKVVFVLKPSRQNKPYVELVEYDNIEGLVLCTEITKYKANLIL
jgi:translation initiation factor 2 alpha subunit (eIF-2alpha)